MLPVAQFTNLEPAILVEVQFILMFLTFHNNHLLIKLEAIQAVQAIQDYTNLHHPLTIKQEETQESTNLPLQIFKAQQLVLINTPQAALTNQEHTELELKEPAMCINQEDIQLKVRLVLAYPVQLVQLALLKDSLQETLEILTLAQLVLLVLLKDSLRETLEILILVQLVQLELTTHQEPPLVSTEVRSPATIVTIRNEQ